jgi:proteasome accessory factor C
MTANAQSQVERMLALVPYLRDRDGIAVDDVARDFGVKPAQIVKDLKVLWFCGLPNAVTGDMIDIDMEALDGEGVVKLSNADYLTRPLRLAPHEALALLVALRALREVSLTAERDAVDRAIKKLEAASGEISEAAAAVELHLDPVDTQIRQAVEEALRDERQLELTYYVPGRDETTERVVDPMRLIFSDGHSYLEGWCHRAGETRMFRLDRMRRADVLDTPSEPPQGVGVTDLSHGLFQPDPDDPDAVIDLAPGARWVAEYYPIEESEELGDSTLRIRLKFSDREWLQRLILRLGGQATLVHPTDLAEAVRDRARRALAQYPDSISA